MACLYNHRYTVPSCLSFQVPRFATGRARFIFHRLLELSHTVTYTRFTFYGLHAAVPLRTLFTRSVLTRTLRTFYTWFTRTHAFGSRTWFMRTRTFAHHTHTHHATHTPRFTRSLHVYHHYIPRSHLHVLCLYALWTSFRCVPLPLPVVAGLYAHRFVAFLLFPLCPFLLVYLHGFVLDRLRLHTSRLRLHVHHWTTFPTLRFLTFIALDVDCSSLHPHLYTHAFSLGTPRLGFTFPTLLPLFPGCFHLSPASYPHLPCTLYCCVHMDGSLDCTRRCVHYAATPVYTPHTHLDLLHFSTTHRFSHTYTVGTHTRVLHTRLVASRTTTHAHGLHTFTAHRCYCYAITTGRSRTHFVASDAVAATHGWTPLPAIFIHASPVATTTNTKPVTLRIYRSWPLYVHLVPHTPFERSGHSYTHTHTPVCYLTHGPDLAIHMVTHASCHLDTRVHGSFTC